MTPLLSSSDGTFSHETVFGDSGYLAEMAPLSQMAVQEIQVEGGRALLTARERGPVHEVALPLFSPFSGVSFEDSGEPAIHAHKDALSRLGEAVESRFERVRLHLPPSVADVRPLQWRGWVVSPLYTYRASVREGASAWSSASRRTLKKARESFACSSDPDATADTVALMCASYVRQGRAAPVLADRLSKVCQTFIAAGTAETVVARDPEGVVAAGIVLLHGAQASYYWVAGSKPGPAMTVLMEFALERVAQRGIDVLDMVGANTPTIAEFKRRLGGTLTPYWAATFQRGLAMRILAAGRSILGR